MAKNCKPSFKSGRTSIGVWGAFCGWKKGPLVVLGDGRMNQHRYREEILAQHGLPFYQTMKEMRQGQEEVIWMEDGARYHSTKANKKWQAARSFDAMPWPAQSPDLNPIENLWSIIKRRISRKRYIIKTAEEMGIAVQKEWDSLTEADYLSCVDSMQERVRRCLKARGGHIKY